MAQLGVAPDVMIKNVTTEVLEIVRKDRDIQAGNSAKVLELVDSKVLPHFDFDHMTRLAVARSWRQATPDQKKELVEQFRTLLVRTYSKALTEYRNQTIAVKPLNMAPTDIDVKVRTVVNQPGGQPISLDYFLEKVGQEWKVYDVSVAGASLITSYRGEFSTEVGNSGIDGLIKALKAKNGDQRNTPRSTPQ